MSFIFAFRYLVKTNYKIRKAWHASVFKLPLFGNLIRKSILARVSLVMGNLNQAGVDILESLDIAKSVTTNTIVIEAIENIKAQGAEIVEIDEEQLGLPNFINLLNLDMKKDLPAYVDAHANKNVPIKTIADVIEFNLKDSIKKLDYNL